MATNACGEADERRAKLSNSNHPGAVGRTFASPDVENWPSTSPVCFNIKYSSLSSLRFRDSVCAEHRKVFALGWPITKYSPNSLILSPKNESAAVSRAGTVSGCRVFMISRTVDRIWGASTPAFRCSQSHVVSSNLARSVSGRICPFAVAESQYFPPARGESNTSKSPAL